MAAPFWEWVTPILDANGDNWPTPSNYPAPSLKKNSLICKVGNTWYQGGTNTSFTPSASGELLLAANDGIPEDNSRGWTVYVYDTPPGSPPPTQGFWRFKTVDGGGGILGLFHHDVGGSPTVVEFQGWQHVFYGSFYEASGKLNELTYFDDSHFSVGERDGNGGPGGRTSHSIYGQISAVVHQGFVHVFYVDGDDGTFRHASWDGTTWRFEVLDGAGGSAGQVNGVCGFYNAAVSYRGELHVFYFGRTDRSLGPGADGLGVLTGHLRHAVMNAAGGWQFEVLDGQGGPAGRVKAVVGVTVCTVSVSSGYVDLLHVFYHDDDNKTLRHAHSYGGGEPWFFEVVDDGSQLPVFPSTNVGRAPAAVYSPVSGLVYVFYHDQDIWDLRVASSSPAGLSPWTIEVIDGAGGQGGRVKATIDGSLKAAVALPDQVGVFYYDVDHRTLRHGWKEFGSSDWLFEVLDGAGGGQGRITADVGRNAGAIVVNTVQSVFYWDASNGNLRHAGFF